MFEITHAITARLDLPYILDKALRFAVEWVGGEAGLIALREDASAFQFSAYYGIDPDLLPRFKPLLDQVPVTIQRDQTPRWRFPELELRFSGVIDENVLRLRHVMAIPLIASEQLVGLIYIFRPPRASPFTAMDEDAVSGFADHVAIAIEHARLYHAAKQNAQERSAVIEASPQGILIANRDGEVRGMNAALEQLSGWSRQDALGKDYRQLFQVVDEQGLAVTIPTFSNAHQTVFSTDGFLKRRDGARGAFVHFTLAPLYDEKHVLLSIVGNIVDLTKRREAEEAKTTFLAGISHDLKTPIALIRGYAETLRRTDVTWDHNTIDSSLAVIQDEADHLTHLVNALLDAAQLERGRLPLQIGQVCLDELAAKIVERFQSLQEGHRWALEFPADFPAVPADAERIRQVLQNLISNAVKYSPRGTKITVGGWVEPERIGIVVRDEGPGISLEEQASVFERFTRGRGRSVQRAQGAGLGLYLCRAIVEQHGGHIWLENLPERGAAFYFVLPRSAEHEATPAL